MQRTPDVQERRRGRGARRLVRRRMALDAVRVPSRRCWSRVRDGSAQRGGGAVDVGVSSGESGEMEDVGEREVSSRVGEGGGCESRGILAAGGARA